jgi:hypothetical protein
VVSKSPKELVIFGLPKVGKTTALSLLDSCLIVDLESSGTDYVEATAVKCNDLADLQELQKELKDYITTHGKKPYRFIALDTVTALETIILPLANSMYKKLPIGKNWKGTDVTTLPNGAGYRFLREAFFTVKNSFKLFVIILF